MSEYDKVLDIAEALARGDEATAEAIAATIPREVLAELIVAGRIVKTSHEKLQS